MVIWEGLLIVLVVWEGAHLLLNLMFFLISGCYYVYFLGLLVTLLIAFLFVCYICIKIKI